MHEPAFWRRPSSWAMRLLMPLAAVYGAIAAQRMTRKGVKAGIPVFCVGNFDVGGAGKTPTVLVLAKLLREIGESPVVLSRGYGGSLRGPIKVDADRHVASQVGDEPLMMASSVPVVVSRDRADGIALVRSLGASVILMDDGFQNPAVMKDVSLVVIDGDRGLGNGQVIPAGPLRAPLRRQLKRTDVLVIVGEGRAANGVAEAVSAEQKPVFRAQMIPSPGSLAALQGKRVLAFAGIGDPPRFFRTLRASGIDVVAEKAFPDHHPFSEDEILRLRAEAAHQALTVVTTEKDMARLYKGGQIAPYARDIVAFSVTLEIGDIPIFRKFVVHRLFQARLRTD